MRHCWVAFLCLASILAGCDDDGKSTDLSPARALDLIEENEGNPDFVILDVRTAEDFEDDHIENAVNIDFYAVDFLDQIGALDRRKTYLVCCRSGVRSSETADRMRDLGFDKVYSLSGGITALRQYETENVCPCSQR